MEGVAFYRMGRLALPAAVGLVISVFALAPVNTGAAGSSQPEPAHPSVMQQAAGQVAGAKTGSLKPFTVAAALSVAPATTTTGPTREIFGFALAGSLNDVTVGDPTWNFSLLSTVAF